VSVEEIRRCSWCRRKAAPGIGFCPSCSGPTYVENLLAVQLGAAKQKFEEYVEAGRPIPRTRNWYRTLPKGIPRHLKPKPPKPALPPPVPKKPTVNYLKPKTDTNP